MYFTQGEQEPFYEAWERFRELLQKCPHRGIIDWMQMHFFYEGFTTANKRMVDFACGGALMERTPQEAFDQFDLLANNNQQWGSEWTKKVGVHEVDTNTAVATQISSLEKKLETLMCAIIPHSPQQVCTICSDPTHPMELCLKVLSKFSKLIRFSDIRMIHIRTPISKGGVTTQIFDGATSNNKLVLAIPSSSKCSLRVSLRNQRWRI
ncbi:hypothetical protein L3X38_032650 [Prunus dulcis]|uniref:Retrotransposon gag domain-containing protein n=1 Tax=Prunus dulcis TaxID=3755 RepID=A0AAD4VFK6_PRUDU|nr:hypothetical protein L3X38_032650 [Prunus dulcis]